MDNLEFYIKLAVIGFYIIVAIVVSIRSLVKSFKKKNENENEKTIYEQYIEIFAKAKEFIEQAEKFVNYSPEEKHNYVLTRLKEINQTVFDELGLTNLINNLVAFTKSVNVNSEKKS